jgi:hypothetical protein
LNHPEFPDSCLRSKVIVCHAWFSLSNSSFCRLFFLLQKYIPRPQINKPPFALNYTTFLHILNPKIPLFYMPNKNIVSFAPSRRAAEILSYKDVFLCVSAPPRENYFIFPNKDGYTKLDNSLEYSANGRNAPGDHK